MLILTGISSTSISLQRRQLSLHTAVAFYSAHTVNSPHVPLSHHCGDISINIIKCLDDQYLIYSTYIETGFTKGFTIQDKMKRSVTRRNDSLNVYKENDKIHHS